MNSNLISLDIKELSEEFFIDRAEILSTHRFLVSSQDSVFILEQGNIDLYSLSFEGQHSNVNHTMQYIAERFLSFPGYFFPGQLNYLSSFHSGDWLFPFPLNDSNISFCILAVARGNCTVSRISLPKLRQALPLSTTLQMFALIKVQEWIKRLKIESSEFSHSSFPLILNPYEKYSLETGAIFFNARSKEGGIEQDIYWLKVDEGNVCEWGLPSLAVQDQSILYPFRSLEWFKCLKPSLVEIFPSRPELTTEESLWKGLSLYQTYFLRLLEAIQYKQQIKSQHETQLKIQRDHTLLDQSIEELQSLLNPEPSFILGYEQDLLYQACQAAGNYWELKFKKPKIETANTIEERLQSLCMNSQIYFRRVRLFDQWLQTQASPLVAFYKKDAQPVALIPHPTLGYQLFDPATKRTMPITQEITKSISTVAYMFYRQLPAGKVNLRQIGKFSFFRRGREWMTFLFLVLCGTLASLSIPIITRLLFDVVIPNRNESLLFEIILGAFIISVATLAFNYGRESIILRLENLSDHDLSMAIWQRLINFPIRFFRSYSIYDLFTFTSAVSTIRQMLTSHIIQVFLNAFFAIVYFALMFYYSGILAAVGVMVIAIEFLGLLIPLYFGVQYGRQLLDRQIQANNKMLEMVEALTKVRLAGAEARMFHRWEQAYARMQQMDLKLLFLNLKSSVFNNFWSNTSTWILYLVVILMITSQSSEASSIGLTLGGFMAFMSVYSLFSSALSQLGGTLLDIIGIIPLWEKSKHFTQTLPEEFSNQEDPGTVQGEIRLDHLTFGYSSNRSPVIQDISLTIRAGEAIAIVGPSGCGKTTLLRLLLGFERSDQGSIYYDNKDLRGLDLQALRRQMGVVLQSGAIFDGTILDNINGGRYYSVEEVKEALHLSGATSFIQELSMGIHTVLTNRGSSLSGGQRQMILLARAIVGKPKILILDEATSSLDNEKQKIVHENLSRLPMTRIIVAQRVNAVQHVDRIYVMDKGRIADSGTFAELAGKPGFFSDLLAKQSLT